MKNKIKIILKFFQKFFSFLFLFFMFLSIFDKTSDISTTIIFLIFAIIIYPSFYKKIFIRIKNLDFETKKSKEIKKELEKILEEVKNENIINNNLKNKLNNISIKFNIKNEKINIKFFKILINENINEKLILEFINIFFEDKNYFWYILEVKSFLNKIYNSIDIENIENQKIEIINDLNKNFNLEKEKKEIEANILENISKNLEKYDIDNILNFINTFFDEKNIFYKEKIKLFLKEYFLYTIKDFKITDKEKEIIEYLWNKFDLEKEDFWFDQNLFNRYHTIFYLLDKNEIPEISINWDLPILKKKDEKVYWLEKAFIYKTKTETIRSNYSHGMNFSIKIAKWIRYNVWSYKTPSYKHTYKILDDAWFFIISNKRVWFIWDKMNFWINYDKIVNIYANEEWLVIMKENKQSPYILSLEEYNVALLMISKIINEE